MIHLTYGAPLAIYTLLPCRADALAFGVLIAIAVRNEKAWNYLVRKQWSLRIALLALGLGFPFLSRHIFDLLMTSIGYTWISMFYAALLLVAITRPSNLERRLLTNVLCLELGAISYALYVCHQGVNWLNHWLFFRAAPSAHDWPSLLVTCLSLLIAALVAKASWRILEQPILRKGQQHLSAA